ncbi:alkaline phosphatase [Prolixibacteraceae bacterium JC049]|nr:alkaline phosphatase [Prolixibacteraceae bacterium JC049]
MVQVDMRIIVLLLCLFPFVGTAQEEYKDPKNKKFKETFEGGLLHKVTYYPEVQFSSQPKNIILMIGDGMGVAQVFAGMTANQGRLYLENFKHVGFSRTQSADNYITDSAAGGTALACGVKTYNHAIGLDANGKKVENVCEVASKKGMNTGVVTTALVNHATPAVFYAHQPHRNEYEAIAYDLFKSDIDVAIGGGRKHFENRTDGLNISDSLRKKGMQVVHNVDELKKVKKASVVGLFADMHVPHYPERGQMLSESTEQAIRLLNENSKGFFLMVEASKIDAGGHQNKTPFVTKEMLDFDQAIGRALEFAVKDRETLVIVTADHETGGMSNTGGVMQKGEVSGQFIWGKHTGTPVPIFAFGPGAKAFTGIMQNTAIARKMMEMIRNRKN